MDLMKKRKQEAGKPEAEQVLNFPDFSSHGGLPHKMFGSLDFICLSVSLLTGYRMTALLSAHGYTTIL
jgi:hypothetical protein